MKNRISTTMFGILLGLMMIVLLATPGAVQAAASPASSGEHSPAPSNRLPAKLPAQTGEVLENILLREQLALNNQENRLELSRSIAETTQVYIDNQKEKGKDTADLESALKAFNQSISEAETSHAEAASLLESPEGFDESGQVVDREAARNTVREAGQALRQTHWSLTNATLELRLAIQAYRSL